MNKQQIPAEIREAIRHNALIPFIGSGYSKNIALPTWLELARKFVDALLEKDPSLAALQAEARETNANPLKILNALSRQGHKDACKSMLKGAIDIDLSKHNLQNQEKIWRLSQKVITTNYDQALEGALTDDLKEEVDTITPADNLFGLSSLKDLPYLFKIHGTITRPEGCVLFQEDYDNLYKYNHRFLGELKGMCANATILFIGYSIADIEIQQILRNIHGIFHTGTRHFILSPGKTKFEKLGIKTISLESYDHLVPYLDDLVAYREKINKAFRDIVERVNLKYAGKKNLLDQFGKESDIREEKEKYLDTEDKKDILQLESLDSRDAEANKQTTTALIDAGKGDLLKAYLLQKSKARKWNNEAFFQKLEEKDYDITTKVSLEEYEKALDLAKDLFGTADLEIANLYNAIGSCHLDLGHGAEAEHYYQEGLEITSNTNTPTHQSYTAMFYNNLGNFESAGDNHSEALAYYQKSLKIVQELGEPSTDQMRNVAATLMHLKRYPEAIEMWQQVTHQNKGSFLFRAMDYKALGLAYHRVNQNAEAIKYYRRAIALFFYYYGKENNEFLMFYNDIGYFYGLSKDYEKAIVFYQKVITLETNDEHIFIAMNNMGEAYLNAGNFKMAKETFERSFEFLKSKISEKDYPAAYAYCTNQIKLATEKLGGG
jgi:tetratricopeptide (TPR) repeat protein